MPDSPFQIGGIAVKKREKGRWVGYAFVLPAVIYMLVFIGYPIIYNWVISFQDATAYTLKDAGRAFIGLTNYQTIFADPTFARSIQHTFIYTIGCLIIQFTLGFALAMFFSKKFTLAKPIRGLVVISWMLPVTVTALVFKFMFSQDSGIINTILMTLDRVLGLASERRHGHGGAHHRELVGRHPLQHAPAHNGPEQYSAGCV